MTPTTVLSPSTPRTSRAGIGERKDYHALNAQLNLFASDGTIQFEKDREAAAAYLTQQVMPNTRKFADVWDRLRWLISNNYYESEFLAAYDPKTC